MEPAEIVPPDAYSRGFHHDDAALVLDGWLRRLASQETRCRAVLGRLAGAFLKRRGQHELGFSRLDDYARERLGLSGRELQSLATVMGRLDGLPALRAAFEAGLLSWAQVRLLAGVATAETEGDWLPSRAATRCARSRRWSAKRGRPPTPARTTSPAPASACAARAGSSLSGTTSSSWPAAWR